MKPPLKGVPQLGYRSSVPKVEVMPCEGAEMVRLSPFAVALPSRFRGTVDDPAVPYVVDLQIAFDGDRVTCESLTCRQRARGGPITSEGMTRVRAAELVHAAAREAVVEESAFIEPGQPAVMISEPFEVPPPPEGRAGPNDEHLRALGVIYTVAYACGGSPRREVMEQLSLTRTTANRWVKLARERGHLIAGREDGEG